MEGSLNGWYELVCLFCDGAFKYRFSKEKLKAIKKGYSVDVQCPKCKNTGLLSLKDFEKLKESRK